jgi:hypothetical protein
MAAAPDLTFNIDDPPERPELHASRQKLSDLLQPSYWQVITAKSYPLCAVTPLVNLVSQPASCYKCVAAQALLTAFVI